MFSFWIPSTQLLGLLNLNCTRFSEKPCGTRSILYIVYYWFLGKPFGTFHPTASTTVLIILYTIDYCCPTNAPTHPEIVHVVYWPDVIQVGILQDSEQVTDSQPAGPLPCNYTTLPPNTVTVTTVLYCTLYNVLYTPTLYDVYGGSRGY